MPPPTIRLRDTPAQVQAKLGLSNEQFDELKDCARQVHEEYCATNPDSKWADATVSYSRLPPDELREMMRMMNDLCRRRNVFSPGAANALREAGMRQRLYQVRDSWGKRLRRKAKSSSSARKTDGSDGDDGVVGSAA